MAKAIGVLVFALMLTIFGFIVIQPAIHSIQNFNKTLAHYIDK